jgi:hypothetical protein
MQQQTCLAATLAWLVGQMRFPTDTDKICLHVCRSRASTRTAQCVSSSPVLRKNFSAKGHLHVFLSSPFSLFIHSSVAMSLVRCIRMFFFLNVCVCVCVCVCLALEPQLPSTSNFATSKDDLRANSPMSVYCVDVNLYSYKLFFTCMHNRA